MSGTGLPIFLAVLGLIAALVAQRNMRRGGARFYQLERDVLLRRANYYLMAAMLAFVISVGLLVYNQSLMVPADEIEASLDATAEAAPTAESTEEAVVVENVPPTTAPELIPTEDPNKPTPTPTPVIVRAEVNGTGGSGVYLRDAPSTTGAELEVLDELTIVTIVDSAPTEAEGFLWVNVRTLGGIEGWVVDNYLREFER